MEDLLVCLFDYATATIELPRGSQFYLRYLRTLHGTLRATTALSATSLFLPGRVILRAAPVVESCMFSPVLVVR
jgi:hypothetical protein